MLKNVVKIYLKWTFRTFFRISAHVSGHNQPRCQRREVMAKERITVKTSPCPSYCVVGNLRRIARGLLAEAIDLDKFAIGGCCIPDNPPELACTECPWSGYRGHLIKKCLLRIHLAPTSASI